MYKEYTIDKSLLTAEELAQYEALVAKATVDPAANQEEEEDNVPPAVPPKKKKPAEKAEEEEPVIEKSAPIEVPDFVKAAIAKSEKFIEDAEKKDMATVAKKYAMLVEDTDALAEQLYSLKKSDSAMYDTCIAMMDKQAALIEKSPLFGEIGKSGSAGGNYNSMSGAEAKADAKAKEIMKADPNMSYTEAIAKAWDDPALAAEYDAEYFGN